MYVRLQIKTEPEKTGEARKKKILSLGKRWELGEAAVIRKLIDEA